MKGEKRVQQALLPAFSISLAAVSLASPMLAFYYSRMQFQLLGAFCNGILERSPDSKQLILEVLKFQKEHPASGAGENILSSFGYSCSDFGGSGGPALWIAAASFLAGTVLFFCLFRHWHKRTLLRIETLTRYLEQANAGGQGLLFDPTEDEFSKLRDEIYKTITTLHQAKDTAQKERNRFADNLSNIAHQLKTPITALSLSLQMMKAQPSADRSEQMKMQLDRLTYLQEALLLLSRIDAGTLALEQSKVDVFTLLCLAADNLQELLREHGVCVEIPESENIDVTADLDWTMEAVINLLKNCMEHSQAGAVIHCAYERNPLYVQIRIWDDGSGFAKEDLPYLFERFYRGKECTAGGVGIGLSLSKAIIEMQNGIIRAFNLPDGGACFEIRFYCH